MKAHQCIAMDLVYILGVLAIFVQDILSGNGEGTGNDEKKPEVDEKEKERLQEMQYKA